MTAITPCCTLTGSLPVATPYRLLKASTLLPAPAGASCVRTFVLHIHHLFPGDAQEIKLVLKEVGKLGQAAHADGLDRDFQ